MIYGSVCSGIDLGERFGRLTIIEIYSPRRRDQFRIVCKCDCGERVDCVASDLTHGKRRSCGCYRRDRAGALYRTHGKSQTIQYCMFYDARKRAAARGLPFDIEPSDIKIPERCPVLGIKLSPKGPRDQRPSLDRVIPDIGYTPSNVCVISFRANRLKSDATADEIRSVLSYVEGWS